MMKMRITEIGLFRFGIVGILTTTIHLLVFTIFIEIFSIAPVFASIPAFIVAMIFSYFINHKWTFQAKGHHYYYLPKYILVSVTGLLLNIIITYVVVDIMGLWYGFSLLLIIIVVPVANYVLNKKWTFKRFVRENDGQISKL